MSVSEKYFVHGIGFHDDPKTRESYSLLHVTKLSSEAAKRKVKLRAVIEKLSKRPGAKFPRIAGPEIREYNSLGGPVEEYVIPVPFDELNINTGQVIDCLPKNAVLRTEFNKTRGPYNKI